MPQQSSQPSAVLRIGLFTSKRFHSLQFWNARAKSANLTCWLLVSQANQYAYRQKLLVDIDSRTSFEFDFQHGFSFAKRSRRLVSSCLSGFCCANRRFVCVGLTTLDTGCVHQDN